MRKKVVNLQPGPFDLVPTVEAAFILGTTESELSAERRKVHDYPEPINISHGVKRVNRYVRSELHAHVQRKIRERDAALARERERQMAISREREQQHADRVAVEVP